MWNWKGKPIRGIVFDVDGTLYSQPPVRRAMLLKLMRAYWSKPHAGWRTARLLSAFRKAQETLRTRDDVPADLAAAQLEHALQGTADSSHRDLVERWMEQEPLDAIARFARPGLIDFCEQARQAHVQLGVFSDYPAVRKLATLGLTRYLGPVMSAQDPQIRRFKPHPAGLHAVLDRMGLSPAEAVYVGDRPDVDAPAAAAAGMPCFLFAPAVPAASWTPVSSFPSLAQMFQDHHA